MESSVKFIVILKLKHKISKKPQACCGLFRLHQNLHLCLSSSPPPLGTFVAEALLCHLFSHCVGCFTRVMALIDKVTNLLTIHHEVNSICGEDQEAVISMMELQSEPHAQDYKLHLTLG